MAVPAWATDLTDIWVGGSIASWTAIGGGASGLNQETDYFIQGTDCVSKNAWTNARKGMIYNNGSSFTVPADGVIVLWGYYAATNSLDTLANGGVRMMVGSGSGDYWGYNLAGKDTLTFDSWIPYVLDPNGATPNATTGTPTGTEQYVGINAFLPTTSGPTKGSPLGADAIRYGRHRISYTAGSLADGYNTFNGAEVFSNDVTRRWGNIELARGVYRVQGFHSFGTSGAAVDFNDANKVLLIRSAAGAVNAVTAAYNRFEVLNAASVVVMDNIIVRSLNTVSKGTWVTTAGSITLTNCQFIDMATFAFLASSQVTGTTFRRCGQITAPGTTMTNSVVASYTGAADTSAVVWNVATDPDGKLNGMEFVKGTNAHHALELGLSSPTSVTLRGMTFTGFNAADGQNDSVIHVKRTSGAVTINAVGCTGTVSYKSDGANVTVVQDPVTLAVHVQDINTGAAITGARVWIPVSSGAGGKPYNASVTITAAATIATVTHTGHGLATNDYVDINGANEVEYNGTFQITVTGANTYTYTMSGSPSSPATGTITSTFVVISGTTDGTGDISATYTYAADQPISGRVRTATGGGPYYKTSPVGGSIDSVNGLSVTVQMIPDA